MTVRFPPLLLIDFDGTITCRDSELFIAQQILDEAGQRRLAELVGEYEHLEITLLEYYERYFSLMNLHETQWRRMAAKVPVREDFNDFINRCRHQGIEMMILSEGLDLFIEPLLGGLAAGDLPCSCNRVVWRGNRPGLLPAVDAVPCDRCLNCKGAHARRFRSQGRKVVLIGNGASDLCAAREADRIYARDHLARLCAEEGIPFIPWQTFREIDLDSLVSSLETDY